MAYENLAASRREYRTDMDVPKNAARDVPDEIYEWWKAGLESGKNNKTARRDAVLIWNEQNPDNQLTPAEVGIVCRVGDSLDDRRADPPDTPYPTSTEPRDGDGVILADMTKKEIKVWAKENLGLDVPKMNKVDMVKFVQEASEKRETGQRALDAAEANRA